MGCDVRRAPVNIVCVGNALHGDDGLGEAVFDTLRDMALPAGVRLMRAPFMGADALACFEACEHVVLVDVLQGFGAPGSIHVLAPEDIADEAAPVAHGAGLGAWLAQLPQWLDFMPRVEIIGVEAGDMTPFSPGLSAPVRAALDGVCQQVLTRSTHA